MYLAVLISVGLYQMDKMGVTPSDLLAIGKKKALVAYEAMTTDPAGAVTQAYAFMAENRALQMIMVWLLFKMLAYYFKLRVQRDDARQKAAEEAATAAAPAAAGKASNDGAASKGGLAKKKK